MRSVVDYIEQVTFVAIFALTSVLLAVAAEPTVAGVTLGPQTGSVLAIAAVMAGAGLGIARWTGGGRVGDRIQAWPVFGLYTKTVDAATALIVAGPAPRPPAAPAPTPPSRVYKCPECGAEVSPGSDCPACGLRLVTCAHCGAPTRVDDRFCASCGTELTQQTPRPRPCGSCGRPVELGDQFCGACGAAVQQDPGTGGSG